ncbi:MAG: hypothetical protein ACRCTW_10885, partial [Lactococcus garvieae]
PFEALKIFFLTFARVNVRLQCKITFLQFIFKQTGFFCLLNGKELLRIGLSQMICAELVRSGSVHH